MVKDETIRHKEKNKWQKLMLFFILCMIRVHRISILLPVNNLLLESAVILRRIKYDVLTNDALKVLLYEITPEHKIKFFEETGDVDFAYEVPGLARYRVNYFQQKNGIGAVFREIPDKISTCAELGLPQA